MRQIKIAIDKVIAAYKQQPTEILLTETILLTTSGDENERLKKASAANLGYTRGGLYLDSARSLIGYILANEREISWRKGAYDVLLPLREIAYRNKAELPVEAVIELDSIVAAIEGAKYLAKDAEILWHFYAMSLDRCAHFFSNASTMIGVDFAQDPDTNDYLHLIRAFRNHMEHREKTISSLAGPDWISMFQETEEGISFGYPRDINGDVRFEAATGSFQGTLVSMPLNQSGFGKFERIIQDTHASIESTCIYSLESHLAEHPESIPDLRTIGNLMVETLTSIS